MNTLFLLMAHYGGKAVLPADVVRRDFFTPLTLTMMEDSHEA